MENFSDLESGKNFLNITQKKSKVIQEKISKSDIINNLKFALQKKLLQNENASHSLEENMYKYVSDRELVSRLYKECL